jgi:hypothetical protein
MSAVTDHAPAHPPSTGRWQAAKRKASELTLDLPEAAPGTHVYIVTAGLRHELVVLLRAFARAAERAGHKVRLL